MEVLVNKGIIHRDLKMENILLYMPEIGHEIVHPVVRKDIVVKISDFGLAKFLNTDGIISHINYRQGIKNLFSLKNL